jgi:hypothetical protein
MVCTGAKTLEVLLHNKLNDMTIEYKQWVMIDRAETLMMVKQQSENLVPKIPELTRHHYTTK